MSIEDQDGFCKIEDLCIQYEATRSSFDIEDRTGGDSAQKQRGSVPRMQRHTFYCLNCIPRKKSQVEGIVNRSKIMNPQLLMTRRPLDSLRGISLESWNLGQPARARSLQFRASCHARGLMSNQSLSSLALTKVAMSTSYLPSFTPVTPFTLNVTQLSHDEDADLARKQLLHENPKSFDVHGHRELLEHELLICYVSRTLDFFLSLP